jgi:hypothetical protein
VTGEHDRDRSADERRLIIETAAYAEDWPDHADRERWPDGYDETGLDDERPAGWPDDDREDER